MHPAEAALAELAQGAVDGARRDELEAHLETCASCRDVLASVLSALSHEERAQPVGRFGSLEPIGVGAMGEVFSARDSVLERAVALKWLYPAMPGAEGGQLRQRLLAEARALAKVQHPNVVSVFDVIEWGRTHVIVMELVRGGSLRAWLAQPHDWREVVRVFTGAGEGLAAVHAAGLVHRDFKPDNVLLDEHGTARVSDFGLVGTEARAGPFSDASLTGARLTRTSALRGTPVYMSPELFAGEPGTAASDQFAFCASLYEALIGQRPFQGTTLAELARAAATGDTLEPRGFPRWLVQLLRRGLAADPAKRFASMRELLDTLVEAPRRRRRWQLGLGATALLALAVAARGALAPDPCADGPARLAKVWPAAAGADLPSELRVWLDDSARRWNETWNHECGHGTEAEWRRTRGCLEAALDDLESVSAAARAGGPSKPASVLAQYVARPAACVNADNPARSALPAAPDARSKVVDALAALIDVAQLEAKEDLEGADARAAEAVSLASSHAPTRARALLARSRFQFNLGHAPEALESVAQAKQLAQSSGALREIARADLEAAFEPCALGRNAECASVLDRVAVMATALDDPYLRTLIEELRVSSDWKNPATSATLAGIVEQWKALPGTSAEVERSRGMYVTKLNNDGEFEKALMVTRDTLPECQAPDSFAGCVALHARGRALAGLGRIDEALASYLVLEEAITRLGLTQMRTIVTHDRTMLLIERGRSEEALASLPAGFKSPYSSWCGRSRSSSWVASMTRARASTRSAPPSSSRASPST